ncbi:unnamed protein product [Bursaphelenchus xylophilus]|uniref:(pine wood nematode) hypothetical protein n=1 Tax=Bursaphelenchus xylophilus TaxID=6326 RepID=A0A1I7S646_BURXY|nr:unnamed protein product [Bursaphelenchus xylophilus]CAG9082268.1 unnamed protein product [Bursaphelenchus xylophilus]
MVSSITNMFFYLLIVSTYEIEVFNEYNVTLFRGIFEYFPTSNYHMYVQCASFCFFAMHVIVTLFRFIYRYAQAEDGREFQREYPETNMELKKYFTEHPMTSLSEHVFFTVFPVLVYPLTLLVGTWCTIQCHRFQSDPQNKLSIRTKEMYKLLIFGLVIEQVAEVVWFVIPTVFAKLSLRIEDQAMGNYIVYRVFYTYPTFLMIFTLTFYRRYRQGVVRVLRKVVRIPAIGTISTTRGNSTGQKTSVHNILHKSSQTLLAPSTINVIPISANFK